MSLLEVRDLETAYATDDGIALAVRGVSFNLEAGETLGLVGESGCGKSATALSIMGLLPPGGQVIGGSVQLEGAGNLLTLPQKSLQTIRGKRIAMIFQDSMASLNPVLSIGKQITESLETHLHLSGSTAVRRAAELLAEVGVPDPARRLKQFPHQLSGGLRQRVAISIALATNPDILIADEPTTALDVTIQAQVLDLLKREHLDRKMAIVLITHDLGVVAGMADRLCVMYAGRIVEQGPTDELFAAPQHPYTLALLRSVPRMDSELQHRLSSIPGSPPMISQVPEGCAFQKRCPVSIPRCVWDDPQLEHVNATQQVACWVATSNLVR